MEDDNNNNNNKNSNNNDDYGDDDNYSGMNGNIKGDYKMIKYFLNK